MKEVEEIRGSNYTPVSSHSGVDRASPPTPDSPQNTNRCMEIDANKFWCLITFCGRCGCCTIGFTSVITCCTIQNNVNLCCVHQEAACCLSRSEKLYIYYKHIGCLLPTFITNGYSQCCATHCTCCWPEFDNYKSEVQPTLNHGAHSKDIDIKSKEFITLSCGWVTCVLLPKWCCI